MYRQGQRNAHRIEIIAKLGKRLKGRLKAVNKLTERRKVGQKKTIFNVKLVKVKGKTNFC